MNALPVLVIVLPVLGLVAAAGAFPHLDRFATGSPNELTEARLSDAALAFAFSLAALAALDLA